MNLSKFQKIIFAILAIGSLVLGVLVTKFVICGQWYLNDELCKSHIEGYSKLVSIITTVATLAVVSISAFYAVRTYRKSASLEHSKWIFDLYEKFYEKEDLKGIRNHLDCTETTKEVEVLVKEETAEFTDYLNFFEFIAFLKKSGQITSEEINDLFGYYLECLSRHPPVRNYLKPNGYELLDDLLKEIAEKKKIEEKNK